MIRYMYTITYNSRSQKDQDPMAHGGDSEAAWIQVWSPKGPPSPSPIPGSSFGRKKVPDLNPADFSAGFRKNAGDLKIHPDPRFWKKQMIKGWIIHKQTAFVPRVVFSGTHSFHNPTLEPSRSHCPRPSSEWPKSRTITKYKQTCAQAKTSKKKPRSMWQGTPISLQPCL